MLPDTFSTIEGSTLAAFSASNATRAFSFSTTTPGTITPSISRECPQTVAPSGTGNSKSQDIWRELGFVKVNEFLTRRKSPLLSTTSLEDAIETGWSSANAANGIATSSRSFIMSLASSFVKRAPSVTGEPSAISAES